MNATNSPKPADAANPLAAVFAFAAAKKAEEEKQRRLAEGIEEPDDNIDIHVQKSLAKGRLHETDQIKLVMQI